MKLIGCAFRKMGVSLCPTAQDTNACNFLLMWVPFKLGEWLSSVPHSLKYIMYLHILFEKNQFSRRSGCQDLATGIHYFAEVGFQISGGWFLPANVFRPSLGKA